MITTFTLTHKPQKRVLTMHPGELITDGTDHVLNTGRRTLTLTLIVQNTSDRPVQVGSPYHFQ